MSTINQLPAEIIVTIFENLGLHHLVTNCSNTSLQWREIIARHILKPKILKLAKVNAMFKRDIEADGWTEDCIDTEMVLKLYSKLEKYSRKRKY